MKIFWPIFAITLLAVVFATIGYGAPWHQANDPVMVMRRYWTHAVANPQQADDSMVCMYGRVATDSGPMIDSAVVQARCGPPALGGMGAITQPIMNDSIAAAYFVPRLCAELHKFTWAHIIGLIYGIEDSPPRRVKAFVCWSAAP